MILTLLWKEMREHQSIWLTMVVMTSVLGFGLSRIVAPDDATLATMVGALIVLGMGAAYGIVCGGMMLAGEHEGGTLVFLDIFLGRRHLLWLGKFLIGIVLVLAEALAVALVFYLIKQAPPAWTPALVGVMNAEGFPNVARLESGLEIWFIVLPVVTLEAYAWGLFGSAVTRRVLAGAAVAAVAAAPVWLAGTCLPAPVALLLRLLAASFVLIVSISHFVTQSREAPLGPPPKPDAAPDPRKRFIELLDDFDQDDEYADDERPVMDVPRVRPVVLALAGNHSGQPALQPQALRRRRRACAQAESPFEVLWWLTFQQAWGICAVLATASLLAGFFMPSVGQVLWPVATLLLGVACGTAAFAPEQRDLSYHFLSAQHFPLQTIWRYKVGFWGIVAALATLLIVFGALLAVAVRFLGRIDPAGGLAGAFHFGTLLDIMGPTLFFGVWLAYGFCAGQVAVWYCRKNVMALLLAGMVSVAALGVWVPSLLCLGMGGWQLWVPPLAMLAAGHWLVRAWAGGRIKERKPVMAVMGIGLAVIAWAGLNFGYRAWEIPNVGEPVDPVAFRAAIPTGDDNVAGQKIQQALRDFEDPPKAAVWWHSLAQADDWPPGVIEIPRADGQSPPLLHLVACRKMTDVLRALAKKKQGAGDLDEAFEHLIRILVVSRNLRNKAPVGSYVAGVGIEASALEGVDEWLERGKPTAARLRRALNALNRHSDTTPLPLDCLQTECFRASGVVNDPGMWTFSSAVAPQRIPENWLARAIAVSLEMPWEQERKTRLWRLVWAGLFRAVETPHWQLPEAAVDLQTERDVMHRIPRVWLPASEGPGSSMTAAQLGRLLDASWLWDDRLFCSVVPLRAAATRGRYRVDASRLKLALVLFKSEEGKTAQTLDDLVPKYLPKLPVDPYSGKQFRYRISAGEHIEGLGNIRPGQAIFWSTGPDRVDHNARLEGGRQADDDPRLLRDGIDLIAIVPTIE